MKDKHGVIRFNKTKDINSDFELDLNKLSVAYQRGEIPLEEWMQLHRDIGYSLSGFWEIFQNELSIIYNQQIMDKPIDEIEDEIYDEGNVPNQYLEMAEALVKYNPEEDELPDIGKLIKLLRFAEYFYKEINKNE